MPPTRSRIQCRLGRCTCTALEAIWAEAPAQRFRNDWGRSAPKVEASAPATAAEGIAGGGRNLYFVYDVDDEYNRFFICRGRDGFAEWMSSQDHPFFEEGDQVCLCCLRRGRRSMPLLLLEKQRTWLAAGPQRPLGRRPQWLEASRSLPLPAIWSKPSKRPTRHAAAAS